MSIHLPEINIRISLSHPTVSKALFVSKSPSHMYTITFKHHQKTVIICVLVGQLTKFTGHGFFATQPYQRHHSSPNLLHSYTPSLFKQHKKKWWKPISDDLRSGWTVDKFLHDDRWPREIERERERESGLLEYARVHGCYQYFRELRYIRTNQLFSRRPCVSLMESFMFISRV